MEPRNMVNGLLKETNKLLEKEEVRHLLATKMEHIPYQGAITHRKKNKQNRQNKRRGRGTNKR